jgi:hypothetical protein
MIGDDAGIDSAMAESPQSAEPSFGLSITRCSEDETGMFVGVEA